MKTLGGNENFILIFIFSQKPLCSEQFYIELQNPADFDPRLL